MEMFLMKLKFYAQYNHLTLMLKRAILIDLYSITCYGEDFFKKHYLHHNQLIYPQQFLQSYSCFMIGYLLIA